MQKLPTPGLYVCVGTTAQFIILFIWNWILTWGGGEPTTTI